MVWNSIQIHEVACPIPQNKAELDLGNHFSCPNLKQFLFCRIEGEELSVPVLEVSGSSLTG
jgi:D-ribose pyranose/furanose isomerase RbsD